MLIEYELPAYGVKNELFSPPGEPKPQHQPRHRKKTTEAEEKKLKSIGKEVQSYLNYVLAQKGIQKHRFIRRLYALSQKITVTLFIKTVQRAHKYRITDLQILESIALLQLKEQNYVNPFVEIDEDFLDRESYLEGRFSEEVDLSIYDALMEEDEDDG
jgi:hypothetical protein